MVALCLDSVAYKYRTKPHPPWRISLAYGQSTFQYGTPPSIPENTHSDATIGSSSGIGQTTAIAFAKLGAKVVISGRNVAKLEETRQHAEKAGAKVLVVEGDVTKEEDNVALINKTIEHFGQLDILVNNAGIIKTGSIETATMADFDLVMNVNLRVLSPPGPPAHRAMPLWPVRYCVQYSTVGKLSVLTSGECHFLL
ncbi:hypothetical protein BSL78_02951 [Apostichopus japonicus]|uniref:Uncharacterized protein n=1 Tax=Stichopus japonicus TaxID=307972 RepID=A0A2G8LIQ5_STIJA|nr:hypothetical protein BSL78_02951 [Apostichopus japonicus]